MMLEHFSARSPSSSRPAPRPKRGKGRRAKPASGRPLASCIEQLESRALLAISTFGGSFRSDSTYAVLLLDNGSSGFLKKNATPSPSLSFADNSQFLGSPLNTPGSTNLGIGELPVIGTTVKPLSTLYVTSGTAQSQASLLPLLSTTTTLTLPGASNTTPIQPGSLNGFVIDGTDVYGVTDDGNGGLQFTNPNGGANEPTGGSINYKTGVVSINWPAVPLSSDLQATYNVTSTNTDKTAGTKPQGSSQTFPLTAPANAVFSPATVTGTISSAGNVWDITGNPNGTVSVVLRPVAVAPGATPPPAPSDPNVELQFLPGSNTADMVVTWPGGNSPGAVAVNVTFGWFDVKTAFVSPKLGKTVAYPALSALGNSDGIVAGTFSALLSATTAAGSGTISVVARPGEGVVPLTFTLISGSTSLPTSGTLDTVSGIITLRWDAAPTVADFSFITYGTYWQGTVPTSFSIAPGLTPQQRFVADLSRVTGSTISVQSPIASSLGTATDDFFAGFGGALSAGQFVVDADNVFLNANVTTTSILAASARNTIEINRPTSAIFYNITIDPTATGAALPGPNDPPARLVVSETGSLAGSVTAPATNPAGNLSLTASHADVAIAGTVNVTNQTWLLQSPGSDRPYSLTTISPTTNAQAGRIIGDTVGITLGNDAGGDVDITTDLNTLRMTAAATPQSPVLPYDIRVNDVGTALTVDAVPASQNSLSITSAGTLQVNSSIQTMGSVSLVGKTLGLAGPIFASRGDVTLQADGVSIANTLSTGGGHGVTVTAAAGDLSNAGLVTAGGSVAKSVKFATNLDIPLFGLVTVDGTNTPAAGDLVLVKNQLSPESNGIYVAGTAAWTRATEFDAAVEFKSGMVILVQQGPERGAWAYDPVGSVLLGTSPLTFAPATAPRVFRDVAVATTTNLTDLFGLPTIDTVQVAVGDRILVKDQTNKAENGIYVVQQQDPVTGVNPWLRAADANNTAELVAGGYVLDANRHVGYVLKTAAVQVGVTPIDFATFAGEDVLADVVAATTSKLAAAFNATANTLTASSPEVLVIDGVAIATVGQRVLVKNQTDPRQNGVYKLTTAGAANAAWVLTRDTDFSAAVKANTTAFVVSGTVNRATAWQVVPAGVATKVTPNIDPVTFLPFGGTVALTASGNIAGTARVRGQAASLTATGGAINLLTSTGRVTAVAKGDISLDNLGAIDLANIRNTTAGSLTIRSSETISAGSVAAVGTAATPGNVAITSTFGDVVARSVTSSLGSISLTSSNRDVLVSTAGAVANVAAAAGSVALSAPNGSILVDGRLQALGSGNDLTFGSTLGGVRFTANANASAADQLKIVTPAVAPTVDTGAQIAASRLSLTAPTSAPDAKLGSYQTLEFNRSDSGPVAIDLRNDPLVTSLVLEGVTTIDGSIDVKAAGLVVAGAVTATGAAKDVSLTSNTVLSINAPVTATNNISLDASFGSIGTTVAKAGLLTAPGTLDIKAASAASVVTEVGVLKAALSAANASLTVAESSSIDIASVELAGGGTMTATVGSAVNGGRLSIGKIDTKQNGRVILSAFGDIVEDVADADADVIADQATLTSTAGSIDLDVDVGTIAASATQPNRDVSIRDVGSGATAGLAVGPVSAGGTVTIAVAGNLTQTGAITAKKLTVNATAGDVTLSAAGNAAGSIAISNPGRGVSYATGGAVKLDALSGGVVTISAGGLVSQTTALVADNLTVSATNGADIRLDNAGNRIGTFSATSAGSTPGSITAVDSDAGLVLGVIGGGAVNLTVAGPLTQTGAITGSSLAVTNTGGAVTLTNAGNNVATLSGSTSSGSFSFVDTNGFTVGLPGISAGTAAAGDGDINLTAQAGNIGIAASLTAANDTIKLSAPGGTITQTGGAITARVLDWTANARPTFTTTNVSVLGLNLTGAGDISLGTAGQPITVASASAANGNVSIVGSNVTIEGLVQAGGTAKSVQVNAGGNILVQAAGRIVNADPTGTVSLAAGGTISATNTATQTTVTAGNSLTLSAAGATSLSTDIGALTATVTGGGLTVNEKTGLVVASINAAGQAIAITAGGPLTQTGAITGSSLAVTNTGGAVTLTNAGNNVATLSGSTSSGSFSFVDTNGFTVGLPGISAGTAAAGDGDINLTAQAGNIGIAASLTAANDTIKLSAPGGTITQTGGAITARVLDSTANAAPTFTTTNVSVLGLTLTGAGDISLGTAGQPITVASASTANGNVSIVGSNVTIEGLVQAGGTAKSVQVNAGGNILVQAAGRIANAGGNVSLSAPAGGIIAADPSLVAVTAAGRLTLTARDTTSLNTDVNALTATITGGGLAITEASDLSIEGITAQTVQLTAGGPLTQTTSGGIRAASLIVAANGAVSLTTGDNRIDTLSANTGTASFAFGDRSGTLLLDNLATGSLTINAAGTISVNNVVSSGAVVLTTVNGGGLVVSQQANGLLQAATLLDVKGLEGPITIQNGGRIVAPSLDANVTSNIMVSAIVTTADELGRMVTLVNSLPPLATAVYEIVVAAKIPLVTTIVINRPVVLRGQTADAGISGTGGATDGLVLGSGASGSRITALAFSGFTGTAIKLLSAKNVAISGVTVRDLGPSGTGLEINGASTGTTVTASKFINLGTAIKLVSATGATIGSRFTADQNMISNAARAGVFASGICTRTQVIKTAFTKTPRTPTQYSIRGSRSLRVVK